jgi:hypothetical protein
VRAFAEQNFCASEGAKAGKIVNGRLLVQQVPTVVPRQKQDGSCVFFDAQSQGCTIHPVSPFGCSAFDTHQVFAEAERRSIASLRACASSPGYKLLWQMLHDAGCIARPMEERRTAMAAAITATENSGPARAVNTTREKDLAMIDYMLRLAKNPAVMDQWAEELKPYLPKDISLQLSGMFLDATAESRRLAKPGEFHSPLVDEAGRAIVLAAVMRCLLSHRCQHAGTLGPTTFAFLAARVITCQACLPQFMDSIAQTDATADTADECDLCLQRGQIEFTKFRVAMPTGVVVIGDCCNDCRRKYTPCTTGESGI